MNIVLAFFLDFSQMPYYLSLYITEKSVEGIFKQSENLQTLAMLMSDFPEIITNILSMNNEEPQKVSLL